jgi:hypothetical protein
MQVASIHLIEEASKLMSANFTGVTFRREKNLTHLAWNTIEPFR